MREQLQRLLEDRAKQCVSISRNTDFRCEKIEKKKDTLLTRSAEIVKSKATGKIISKVDRKDNTEVTYQVHFQYLIKQKGNLHLEEEVEHRLAHFYKGTLIKDTEINQSLFAQPEQPDEDFTTLKHRGSDPQYVNAVKEDFRVGEEDEVVSGSNGRMEYRYNRLKAVQYAERWWNEYNPAYKKFENDCTNFISQCLHEGGAPMRGYPNRGNGWWLKSSNWSYSWAVANSLRIYLKNSTVGLRTREVTSPDQLLLGDIICYDFEGDGRFNHNTIVTGKDAYGMPLVNAHTYNSRMRYWAYEDSTAYTPNIKYKFFTVVDDE
ncbi:amidase domain-containing protein [Neobacillus sp. D3-1R]|uniref:amidase domain-containing protein n=1 Tax=Neobacillus sp. D3-1R TaxID=3445778 RepID=UPI003F9EC7E8